MTGRMTIELQYRLQAGEIGWAAMAGVWKNRNISMKTKLRVFKCMVRNSILSGQEASNYTELQEHRLGKMVFGVQ